MKRWDRRGVEGLPLKLLIVSLLISLSAPVVLNCMDRYECEVSSKMLISQAERVRVSVTEAFLAGEGNVRVIEVDFPPSMDRSDAVLELGGPLDNATSHSIRCLIGNRLISTLYLKDPPLRLVPKNVTSVLGASGGEVVLSCERVGDRLVVMAEVL